MDINKLLQLFQPKAVMAQNTAYLPGVEGDTGREVKRKQIDAGISNARYNSEQKPDPRGEAILKAIKEKGYYVEGEELLEPKKTSFLDELPIHVDFERAAKRREKLFKLLQSFF